jgi:formamidopyrimidine-DNA glycosylase
MVELPEVEGYLAGLRAHVAGRRLEGVRLRSLFLLRSVEPPLEAAYGRRLVDARRIGKRVVLGLEEQLFLVLHLMISGRLRWRQRGAGLPGKAGLAAFDFEHGALVLTEQSSRKRASLFVVRGADGLAQHDPGGVDPLGVDAAAFGAALARRPHTLKRALCDPHVFSGIGNAWSDEILHRARLSPFLRARELTGERLARLHTATVEVLTAACERHVAAARAAFPDKVTASQPQMAVHGRFGDPCPVCAAPVQRIVYADSQFNYCAGCQTGGRLLADRALSKLLKDDWPRRLEDLE